MRILRPLFFFFFSFAQFTLAQNANQIKIHSHNDYKQSAPFWLAYENGLHSIEIDLFLKNEFLYVTHHKKEIIEEHTIESLYLNPLKSVITKQQGLNQKLQLLIDLKSESTITLNKLIKILNQYPQIINHENVSIVISGNRPDPADYIKYPDFILFDYQSLQPLKNEETWSKIALISLNFKTISNWKGKGKMTEKDYYKVDSVIKKAHNYDKPFRFWATPDTEVAWKTFVQLGVDFINTDDPVRASTYLSKKAN